MHADIRDRIIAEAEACLGQSDPVPFLREAAPVFRVHDRPSWCGIFVRAIWRRAGLSVPDWKMGTPNLWYLLPTRTPGRGDLVFFRGRLGHQAIFEATDGVNVTTLDGNTNGGKVARRTRPIANVLRYYGVPE